MLIIENTDDDHHENFINLNDSDNIIFNNEKENNVNYNKNDSTEKNLILKNKLTQRYLNIINEQNKIIILIPFLRILKIFQ